MRIDTELPPILQTWYDFKYSRDFVAFCEGPHAVPPLTRWYQAVAGTLFASVSGGTADPSVGNMRVVLPDDSEAVVVAVSEDTDPCAGVPVNPHNLPASWLVLVAFRSDRPGAFHVCDATYLCELKDRLGVAGPIPAYASKRCLVCSPAFHWNLCLEPVVAAALGVETYYITRHGISQKPATPVRLRPDR